jgi:hypothetical protein
MSFDSIGSGLEESMPSSEVIFEVKESPEGGCETQALGHAIFTQANSMDELRDMVRDAVRCHFEESEMPSVLRLHLVRDELFTV